MRHRGIGISFGFRAGHCFWSPGYWCPGLSSALPQRVCSEGSSVCQACLSPHSSASQGRACAPVLPQSKPLEDMKCMKWRCRFQPVPGSFGGAGVPVCRGTPTQEQKPWQGSSSLWQTWTQGRGPGGSVTSPNQGVLPGQWFVCSKVNCWQFLETF